MRPRGTRSDGASGHLLGLDGLRGLAALAVLADHTVQHGSDQSAGVLRVLFGMGAQGLTVFFVLSGFLLYRPFAAALLDGTPMQPTRVYVRNRLLRILPAYWVVFVVAAFVVGVVYLHGDAQFHPGPGNVGRLTDPLTIAANLLLVQTLVPATMLTGIAPAWSLTTELTFYLVLPGLAALAALVVRRGLAPKAAAIAPAILLLVVGVTTVGAITVAKAHFDPARFQLTSWGPTGMAVLERSLVAQAALFGLGMLVAWAVEVRRRSGRWYLEGHIRAALLAVAVALAARGMITDLVGNTVLGIGVVVLLYTVLVPAVDGGPTRLARVLDAPPLRGAGLISYSIYLWHLPVISWLVAQHLNVPGAAGVWVDLAMVLGLTIPLATGTYLLVERRALRWKQRRSPSTPVVVPEAPTMTRA